MAKNIVSDNDSFKKSIDTKIINTESNLIQEMALLSAKLNETIEYINKSKDFNQKYNINGLGIIQGSGNSIDVLCCKLMALKEIRNELNDL